MSVKDIPSEVVQWGAGLLAGSIALIGKLYHSRLQKVESKIDKIQETVNTKIDKLQETINGHELSRKTENPTIPYVDKELDPIKKDINRLHEKIDKLQESIAGHFINNGHRK